MNSFISSAMQPIKFFEDLIFDGGYEEFRNDFFKEWEVNQDGTLGWFFRIYKEDNYIVHDFQELINDANEEIRWGNPLPVSQSEPRKLMSLHDEVSTTENINDWKCEQHSISEDVRKRINLKDVVNFRLNKEFLISQRLILQAISEITFNNNPSDNFLNQQLIILQTLAEKNGNLFIEYPICKTHVLSLIEFIIKLFPKNSSQSTTIIQSPNYKEVLIHEIFDFWKGTMGIKGKGSQIMEHSEHDRLISIVKEMVFSEKLPVITRNFGSLPIPKALIIFCFYVLKENLYGKQRGKDYFIRFLKNAFVDLKDYEENTLLRKFATPPANEKWFPKIIQEAIQNKYK